MTPVKNAVRVELKRQNAADNRFNLITTRFGLTKDQLAALIHDGVARWGGASSSGAERSTTASDRAAATSPWQIMRTFMVMPAIVLAAVFVWMASSQVSDYQRTVDLRKNGVAVNATIVRLYTDPLLAQRLRHGWRVFGHAAAERRRRRQDLHRPRLSCRRRLRERRQLPARPADPHSVPVVYDRTNPAVSDLNFYNHIFARDPLTTLLVMLGVMGGTDVVRDRHSRPDPLHRPSKLWLGARARTA